VKDTASGQYVNRGNTEQANVYLSLKHKDAVKNRPFVSAHEPAVQDGDKYVIQWAINPNAVQGQGTLSVSAQDADGNQLNLHKSGSKDSVQFEVNISGDIVVDKKTYSTTILSSEQSAFVVQFSLSCNGKPLKDAQLRASVSIEGGSSGSGSVIVSGIPVATNDEGFYSGSWTMPHSKTPSGKYVLKFYREVDRKRALENREFKEKQLRREEELRRLQENIPGEIPQSEGLESNIEEELSPLFTISLIHDSPATGKLPIRAEVLVLIAVGAVFFAISYQKKQYLIRATK